MEEKEFSARKSFLRTWFLTDLIMIPINYLFLLESNLEPCNDDLGSTVDTAIRYGIDFRASIRYSERNDQHCIGMPTCIG